jgi:hypothetical protein
MTSLTSVRAEMFHLGRAQSHPLYEENGRRRHPQLGQREVRLWAPNALGVDMIHYMCVIIFGDVVAETG